MPDDLAAELLEAQINAARASEVYYLAMAAAALHDLDAKSSVLLLNSIREMLNADVPGDSKPA